MLSLVSSRRNVQAMNIKEQKLNIYSKHVAIHVSVKHGCRRLGTGLSSIVKEKH